MNQNSILVPHPDPWVNLPFGYVREVERALRAHGVEPNIGWIDPSSPRDATIVYSIAGDTCSAPLALVWDEETGWQTGLFSSGRQGARTRLAKAAKAHLGGGLVPSPMEVVMRLLTGHREQGHRIRSYKSDPAALDTTLDLYNLDVRNLDVRNLAAAIPATR